MRRRTSFIFVVLSVMVSALVLTPTNCSAERLLVVPGGIMYLGDIDPHDPKKFRTCEGKIIPIEKGEVRDTDKKCRVVQKLLVRHDGSTFLGVLDPQDPTKFMTCDGKTIAVDKAELKETDQKCHFQGGGGGDSALGDGCFFFNLQRQGKPHAYRDPKKELEEWCAKPDHFGSPCCAKLNKSDSPF